MQIKSNMSNAQLHYHLKILVKSGLVNKEESHVELNPETNMPFYRFYSISEKGRLVGKSFNSLLNNLNSIVGDLGYEIKNQKYISIDNIYNRFKIVEALYDAKNHELNVGKILQALGKDRNYYPTLSIILKKMNKIIEPNVDTGDRRKRNYKLSMENLSPSFKAWVDQTIEQEKITDLI